MDAGTKLFAPDLDTDATFQEKIVRAAHEIPGRIMEICRTRSVFPIDDTISGAKSD